MEVTFWGVRGSIPCPSKNTSFYGGNTSCVKLETDGGLLLIFDAGSGIRLLGDSLPDTGECHLFISHGHLDHIQGLGFFKPLHSPGWTTHIYLPVWLKSHLHTVFNGVSFPIHLSDMQGSLVRRLLRPGETVTLASGANSVKIETFSTNHPGDSLAYKVHADSNVFLYSGDHEINSAPGVRELTQEMLRGVDLAVMDAMYTKENHKPGWGHSTCEDCVELAKEAGVSCLVLTHHAPEKNDWELDALQGKMNSTQSEGCSVCLAREGASFTYPFFPVLTEQTSEWLQAFTTKLTQYKDEYTLLDRILAKAREITGADAGTIFLVDEGELVFAYTHNDSLFAVDLAHKYAYADIRLPLTKESIAGYTAVTGNILEIPDVHALQADAPYRFNSNFDRKSGYHTRSILAVPLFARTGKLLGVMQLINRLDRHRIVQPFNADDSFIVKKLAYEVANVLEISGLVRKNIYRLLAVASVHDPTETGPHAERVGAMAAELYHHWAKLQGENPDLIRQVKSDIRLAAMLHDIGKVGVSDLILKKPGKLDDAEFMRMQAHTSMGALLLNKDEDDITPLAYEIALHHHQKWNGAGYAGESPQLVGQDIPFAARITAIVDVFDALVSPRCYKKPWSFEAACDLLREEAGKHFDPHMVTCFLDIADIIAAVYTRFPDASLKQEKHG